MGDGIKLAIAILVFWVALVFFFFAFHPGGVANAAGANISNPGQMLKFLMDEFTNLAGGGSSTSAQDSSAATLTSAVAGQGTSDLNYPGYTDSSGSGSTGTSAV